MLSYLIFITLISNFIGNLAHRPLITDFKCARSCVRACVSSLLVLTRTGICKILLADMKALVSSAPLAQCKVNSLVSHNRR